MSLVHTILHAEPFEFRNRGGTLKGQNALQALHGTPISLARFYGMLATKGKLLTPHLYYGTRDEETGKLEVQPPPPPRETGLDPKAWAVLKERGHLLLPIVFLLVMLFASGKTVIFSAFMTILVTIATSMLKKSTRMSLKDILDALFEGTRSMVPVAIACASVGLVIGVASLTGFGLSMASAMRLDCNSGEPSAFFIGKVQWIGV